MYLYQAVATSLMGINNDSVDYTFGIGNQGIKSDLIGLISTWIFYWMMIHGLYYLIGGLMQFYVKIIWPNAGTNNVPSKLQFDHIKLSEIAFPLYVCVPVIGDLLSKKGYSRTCHSIEECGGYLPSFLNLFGFMMLLEFIVFFDHWYLLHVWKWGKANLKHDLHHQYEKADEMSVWTGYAFDPLDGFSQGLGIALSQLVFAVPNVFIWIVSLMIGVWTMYIHQGVPSLPWPLMGADYHFIHHKYNWYNFGFFTMFWDSVFGTLKHPQPSDFKISKKQ